MSQDDVRIFIEQPHTALKIGFSVEVVMRRPFEQGRRRQMENPIEIGHRAEIVLMAHIADAWIAEHIVVANLLRAVGRGVVADDDLEIAEGLRQQAFERLR